LFSYSVMFHKQFDIPLVNLPRHIGRFRPVQKFGCLQAAPENLTLFGRSCWSWPLQQGVADNGWVASHWRIQPGRYPPSVVLLFHQLSDCLQQIHRSLATNAVAMRQYQRKPSRECENVRNPCPRPSATPPSFSRSSIILVCEKV